MANTKKKQRFAIEGGSEMRYNSRNITMVQSWKSEIYYVWWLLSYSEKKCCRVFI